MLDSLLSSILGSPQIQPTTANVAANVTIESSNLKQTPSRRHLTSNSTALDSESLEDISSSFSPVKQKRDNSMTGTSFSSSSSKSSYSDGDEQNMSLQLVNNSASVNLDDPNVQKTVLHYLLDKVRSIETLLITSIKENKVLHEEVSLLYQQNDVLSAENVTLKEMIADLEDKNQALVVDIQLSKINFAAEKKNFVLAMTTNARKMERDIGQVEKNLGTLASNVDTISEDIEHLNDLYASRIKNIPDVSVDRVSSLEDDLKEIQALAGRNQVSLEIVKGETEGISKQVDIDSNEIQRLDRIITVTNQYNRRENLVIDGIPEDIKQGNLENTCLQIIHDLGFSDVSSYEVVACHRLKKRIGDTSPPTIIRFVNRKITEFCLKNRWRLKHLNTNWVLSFREDLCDANQAILTKCEKLQNDGLVNKVFTYNGFVKVVKKCQDGSVKTVKLSHMKDIDNLISQ